MGRVTASGGMALSAEDPLTTLTLLEAVLLMNQSKICSLNFELQTVCVPAFRFFSRQVLSLAVGRQK